MKYRHCMTLLGLALLAVLCFGRGQAQAADPAAGQQPKIVFTEKSHDFGKAAPNQELKHSFAFKNTGTGTLIIEDVKAG